MENKLIQELGKALYSDGFRLGADAGEVSFCSDNFKKAITGLYNAIDQITEQLCTLATSSGTPADCRKGCGFCCHQPVFASAHELIYLTDYLHKNFTANQLQIIHERADQKNSRLAPLGDSGLLNARFPCPLLEDESCMCYPARPVSCRIYLSFNVNSCIDFFERPEEVDSIPALMEFPLHAGRIMNEGFIAGLKIHGYLNKEMRIEEGLLIYLSPLSLQE
jgi:Fe-S-cluster containining protein